MVLSLVLAGVLASPPLSLPPEPCPVQAAWVRDGTVTPQVLSTVRVLEEAGTKGLDPKDYDATTGGDDSTESFYASLTAAALRYASDLQFGKMNRPRQCELAGWLTQTLAHSSDPAAAFQQLEPPFPGYRRTLRALALYTRLAQEDDGEPLPATSKPVEPGQTYSALPRLAILLRRLGDLAPGAPASGQAYDGAVVDALKRFQTRHGLDPDGRLGAKTVQQLNTPLAQRVRQLRLTLERWRQAPHEFPRPPIVVNIPEFRLHAMGGDYRTELAMKVVVGKAGRLQTPVFSAEMRYLIFRPYWNVPLSIQRRELVPKIERDHAYLADNDYEVVSASGEIVENGVVSDNVLAQLRTGRLQIRQAPGEKNALGGVKFVFPNENAVYLHDTPARQLFARSRRDFSHGCIRVEKPADLALWVLRDRPEWSRERIENAMRSGAPLLVDLKNPIPVLIVYGTAVVQDDGAIFFFDDLYGLDAALERSLANR